MNDHTPEPQNIPLKCCTKCNEMKPATSEYFHRRAASPDGLNAKCRACRLLPPRHEVAVADGYKVCATCDETKPATTEYFNRNNKTPDGLLPWCKVCAARYRAENKAQIAERMKAYRLANRAMISDQSNAYAEANKEAINERSRQRYAANKEQVKERRKANRAVQAERDRKYREANRAKIRETKRKYEAANKDRFSEARRAKQSRRRALKRDVGGTHTADDIKRQYEAQKGKCYYCHVLVGDNYHVDHVIPLARGGSNGPENLVIACPFCNDSKGTKLPHEWPQGNRLL